MQNNESHTETPVGMWSPLREAQFGILWFAMLVSTTGSWMHETGAGWLMTSLTPSAGTIVLVQAANTLPIFLFALLAGALADRMDKRVFLVRTNVALALVVAIFAFLVHADAITPQLLVLFTFLIGAGAAFSAPAWQALMPELVSRPQLRSAIALNSLGINISRAVGPAVAGFLIAGIGMVAPFALNALSYLVVVAVLLQLPRQEKPKPTVSAEPLWNAIEIGLRHAANNEPLKQTLVRSAGFFFSASALWALIPIIARQLPDSSATVFGTMTACIGAGAVTGAFLLPRLRKRFNTNQVALGAALLLAATLPLLGTTSVALVAFAYCFVAGLAWIAVLTSFHLSAQTALAPWIRARGMSIFLMVFFGAMTLGSLLWGQVADRLDVGQAMTLAGASLAVLTALTRHIALGAAEEMDLSPAMHWPAPPLDSESTVAGDDGPVMVTLRYQVPEANIDPFSVLMHQLRRERLRDGAFEWGLQRSAENPGEWMEWFRLASWQEHLRQHERVTKADQELQRQIRSLLETDTQPSVSHWLSPTIIHHNSV